MIFRRVFFVAAALCFGLQLFADDAPPHEVLAHFDRAVMVEDAEEFTGSYTSTTNSTVQKPNGKARHDIEVVIQVDRPTEGDERRVLVSFNRDGEDLTEKHRAEIEGSAQNDDSEDDKDEADEGESETDFVAPWGDGVSRYVFDTPRTDGSFMMQSFRPKTDQRETEGLATGVLKWNQITLDPVSVKLDVAEPPKPLKRLSVALEFERLGDVVFATRMVTDGLAKVLLMKREFHLDLRWNDIRPQTNPGPGAE